MKDSGIQWIGQIPENWRIERFKFTHQNSNVGESIDKNFCSERDGKLLFYTAGLEPIKTNYSNFPCWKYTKERDLLLARNGTPYVYLPKEKAVYSDHIIRVTINDNYSKRFIRYCLQQAIKNEVVDTVSITTWSVPIWDSQYLSLPSIEQQKRIADFLDQKTTEIQFAIDNTKQTIEEYKKLKQAVITKAVTKGLEPNRKMKDSGIEWIGEIPENWEVCKVRHLGSLQNGISKGGDSFGKGFPFVSYGDVYKNYSIPEKVIGLVETDEEEQERYSVQKGDIFFTRTSETIEEVGFSSVCEKTIDKATFAGFLIRLRPSRKEIDTGYAKYYFRSNHNRYYLVKEMNLVTRASLGQGLLNDMPVCYPPLSEQKSIAEYLDSKCSQIDTLISQKEQFITELEKYKQSLIYEYVTGKRVLN